eukprot:m.182731 g.182731  ORF g.182731 m.182731 type:complete len:91 (+) comp39295_c0_seq48:238-510(+)
MARESESPKMPASIPSLPTPTVAGEQLPFLAVPSDPAISLPVGSPLGKRSLCGRLFHFGQDNHLGAGFCKAHRGKNGWTLSGKFHPVSLL